MIKDNILTLQQRPAKDRKFSGGSLDTAEILGIARVKWLIANMVAGNYSLVSLVDNEREIGQDGVTGKVPAAFFELV